MQRTFQHSSRVLSGWSLVLLTLLMPGFISARETVTVDTEDINSELLSEVVVTSQRRQQNRSLHIGNIDRLDLSTIENIQHQHINELLNRVAGAWVVRGSGQEHQTAIRSPVLTGGGSCGGFLILEDGIPIRPTGFCNVNQLMEVDTEQAQSIELVRGPGNALFGSNALHGIVNVLMPMPGVAGEPYVALEYGANDFIRARVTLPHERESPWFASAIYANDGGFREDSGYQQGKMHIKRRWPLMEGGFTAGFTATDLRQDTASFIFGEDAYKNPELNRSNPNPEAFRDANSQRLYGLWSRKLPHYFLDVRPYLRHSDMQFMHHALPGQPIEENGQVSAGVLSAVTYKGVSHQTIAGLDAEWSNANVEQTQSGPTPGGARQRETRPQGKHYDYEVKAFSIASYVQIEYRLSQRFSLGTGLRLEYIHYDYNNLMLAGNTREDGSKCGFGGCLYTRPADRTDSFTNLAPNASVGFRFNDKINMYASIARGFRVPQMTELYRLQNGQQVSDLDSEHIDSMELGVRTNGERWSVEISVYAMRKRDSAFRDAEGFNISGARSRHRGIETSVDGQITSGWYLAINASYARHTYDFDFTPGRGERFVSGNEIDTAPRWLGMAELRFESKNNWWLGLQLTYLGQYYLEPANRYSYPGHKLVNMRMGAQVSPQTNLIFRLNNIADESVADRADFGAGDYRYLPGRGREMFVEMRYSFL